MTVYTYATGNAPAVGTDIAAVTATANPSATATAITDTGNVGYNITITCGSESNCGNGDGDSGHGDGDIGGSKRSATVPWTLRCLCLVWFLVIFLA